MIGERPADPTRAAVRVRDERLRRASEFGLEDGERAELADRSLQPVRVAVDCATMDAVALPENADLGDAVGTGGTEGSEQERREVGRIRLAVARRVGR